MQIIKHGYLNTGRKVHAISTGTTLGNYPICRQRRPARRRWQACHTGAAKEDHSKPRQSYNRAPALHQSKHVRGNPHTSAPVPKGLARFLLCYNALGLEMI
jgi:hypothetical protein